MPAQRRDRQRLRGAIAHHEAALQRLYAILDQQCACYQFTIGYRNEGYQKDLYDRWHMIADHHANDKHLCDGLQGHPSGNGPLHAAGFAQCPTGYRSSGVAKGGPAKPGSSRHEHHEAADINVLWPPNQQPDVERFRAAAAQAGLCGPPVNDPVRVELPYRKGSEKEASCHFG